VKKPLVVLKTLQREKPNRVGFVICVGETLISKIEGKVITRTSHQIAPDPRVPAPDPRVPAPDPRVPASDYRLPGIEEFM
jgi:F420-0:gamma-glutamyl ligase